MPKLKSLPFTLGQVVATPSALAALASSGQTPEALLTRHAQGDWGDLDEEDWRENNRSLARGLRLLSAYALPDGTKLWIITEADHSATTLLLPDEY
jgi:hypothetical protein